jgi:hypothetical protein
MVRIRNIGVLAIVPVVLFGMVAKMHLLLLPYFGNGIFDYDPAYVYLFNGMGIIRGFAPHHVDHPGTPLQIFIGLVSYLDWFVRRLTGLATLGFEDDVLKDPESYLRTISVVLLSGCCCSIFYLGQCIHKCSGQFSLALLAQSGFLLFGSTLPHFAYVSPEAMTIFSASMMMGLLSSSLFSDGKFDGLETAIAVGFFAALGVTAKVTFLPLLLLPMLQSERRQILVSYLSFALFAVLLLTPAFPELRTTLWFMREISTHTGLYGSGPEGIIDWSQLPQHSVSLLTDSPVLFLALAAVLLTLLIDRDRHDRAWQAAILSAVIVLELALGLKHFLVRYFIPAEAIAPTVLAWSAFHIFRPVGFRFARVVVAGLTAAIVVTSAGIFLRCESVLEFNHQNELSDLAAIQSTLAKCHDPIVIGSYRVIDAGYAIQFALGYVDPRYATQLAGENRELLSYNRWNHKLFYAGEGWREFTYVNELIDKGRDVILMVDDTAPLPAMKSEVILSLPSQNSDLPGERIIRVERAL